jgi:preprotein translocase subunit SecA
MVNKVNSSPSSFVHPQNAVEPVRPLALSKLLLDIPRTCFKLDSKTFSTTYRVHQYSKDEKCKTLFVRPLFFPKTSLSPFPPTPLFQQTNPNVQRFLEKTRFISIFSEADKVHILQILSHLKTQGSEGEQKGLIEWYKMIKEEFGEEIFSLLSNPESFRGASLQEVVRLVQLFVEISTRLDDVTPLLLRFYERKLTISRCIQRFTEMKQNIEAQKYPEKNLEEVLEAFSSTQEDSFACPAFPVTKEQFFRVQQEYQLKKEQFYRIKEEYLQIDKNGKMIKELNVSDLVNLVEDIKTRCSARPITSLDKLTLVAVGREAMRRKFKIFPYNTQILTLLRLLQYPSKLKGRIAQVRTGEGKSTIVTLQAFYFACQGKTVDVMSTSRYLAKRDQEKYADFFETFGIKTSHLCTDEPTEENFAGQVIYGTNYDFEFAYMRDMLGQENLRRIQQNGKMVPRPLKVVIVDEVDSLFIDMACDAARIAIPGRREINWIYAPILSFVQQNKEVLSAIRLVPENALQPVKEKIIQALRDQLLNFQEGKFKDILQSLKKAQLEVWIGSAYCALYEKKVNEDYVIKPVESGKTYRDQVVIVDRKTGRLMEKNRWQNIHEFLEAKHDLPIAKESSMSASLCHPVYINKYEEIFGVSGTMGPKRDREEIEDIYNVDTIDIPPHKPNQRQRLEPKIFSSQESFLQGLLEEVRDMQKQQRPTLILFETIHETEKFSASFKEKGLTPQLLNERQAANEEVVIAKAGTPGTITIATNAAGRGTDIIPSPSSLKNGGLHVILTFFSENERIEYQGFGRAGRQGQPGSCRLILFSDSQQMENLKQMRERMEIKSSQARKQRVVIASINHQYLSTFFEQCQNWLHTISDSYLEETHRQLPSQMKKRSSSAPLDPLRQAFIYQATQVNLPNFSWVPFLKNVRRILQIQIQQDWAELFYDRLDDLHEKAKKMAPSEEEVKTIYANQIEKLYLSKRSQWESALLNPQQAFQAYLSKITQ